MARPFLYLNPDEPIATQNGRVTEFWYYLFQQMQNGVGALIDLATEVTGLLPIANGGTNASNANTAFANLSPLVNRGDLITRNATVPIRLGIGASGTILGSDGTDPAWTTLAGAGVVSGPVSSVDSEIALFSGATGKLLKSATGTGVVHATAGVFSVAPVNLLTEVANVLPLANGGGLSGVYNPILTLTTNLDAATPSQCQWCQVGNVVTVSGKLTLDPTAAASTVLGISVPVASVFANDYEAGGTAFNPAVFGEGGAIFADPANARLTLQFIAASTTSQVFYFHATYRVI